MDLRYNANPLILSTMKANSRTHLIRRLPLRQQDARVAWLLITPSLLIILSVTLWPIISTFVLSFYDAPTGVNQVRTFIGFNNYLSMLKDKTFWETIGRTIYFTFVSVSLELVLGLAVAQLIQSRPWGWKTLPRRFPHLREKANL